MNGSMALASLWMAFAQVPVASAEPEASAAAARPACSEAQGWRLVPELSDEFDGASLDAAKWADWCASFPGRSADGAFGTPCTDGFRFSPDNVAVTNGELVLTARLLSEAEKTHENEYLRRAPWSTAIVKSRQKQCYGCFEIRAKVMKACVSNAFWLYDPHSDEPKVKFSAGDVSEEIDVFESKGAPSFPDGKTAGLNRFIGTMHFYCTPYLEGVVNRRKRTDADCAAARRDLDFNLADDYHVYTFVWTPERLAWYLDGQLVSERQNDGRYHRPLHVTLDAEVFVGWFGTPDPATLPAKFRIDYVRTWACPPPRNTAVLPRRRIEPDCYDWFERHDRALETAKVRDPEVVFVGDSITHFWAGRDSLGGEEALPRWKAAFGKWRTLNLGYGWDRTGNVLWRLDHGELDGIDPKLVVVHIGGNNFATTRHYAANTAEETAEGVLAVVDRIRAKLPQAKVVVMGIFPFGERPDDPRRVKAKAANAQIAAAVATRTNMAYVDITDRLVAPDGRYPKALAKDFVHPTDAGYAIWLEALKPHLSEVRPPRRIGSDKALQQGASAKWAERLWLDRGGFWRQRVRVTVSNDGETAATNASVAVRIPALKGTRREAWRLVDADGVELEYAVAGDDTLVVPAVVGARSSSDYYVYWDNDAAWGLSDFWPKKADAKSALRVTVGEPERLTLREIGADAPWASGDWDSRVAVNVYNFAYEAKTNVLASVDADEVLRAARAPVYALLREGRVVPTFRTGNVLNFATTVPARSVVTCWAYVRNGTVASDGLPKPVEPSKLGSEIPSDQVYVGTDEMTDADRETLRRFAASPANLLDNPLFEKGDWKASAVKGVAYSLVDDPAFGKVAKMVQDADKPEGRWVGRQQSVAAVGGRTYLVGAFLKGEDATAGDTVHVHLHAGKRVDFTSAGAGKGGTCGWRPAYTSVRLPDNGDRLSLHLTSCGRGTLYHAFPLVAEVCPARVGRIEAKPVAPSAFMTEAVPSVFKVFKETPVRDRARPLALALARNETEELQVAVKCGADATVTAEMTAPTSATGRTLALETGTVGFVPVDFPSAYYGRTTPERVLRTPNHAKGCDGFSGWWPDPVEPGNRLALKANETGSFRFSVRADGAAEPGVYRSEIRWLRDGVEVRREPVEVTVWNFAVPERPTFAATYDVRLNRPGWMAPGEKDNAAARRVKDAMAKYGICPDSIDARVDFKRGKDGRVTADFAAYDRAAAEFFDHYRFPSAYMPRAFYGFGWGHPPRPFLGEAPFEGKAPYAGVDRAKLRPAYKAAYQAALRLYWEHVKAKGWADRLVLYISDEPYMNMPEVREQMKAMCAMIHEVDPAIRIYSSTWRHCPDWDRSLDVWGVGAYGCFPTNEMVRLSREGKGIWFTTDGQQCLDTPFCAIERMQTVYCWAYGAEKYEFWGCTWLTQDPRTFGWHHFIRQSGKPGETSWVRYPNGDGYHFYPPADPAKDATPVPSLRVQAIRDGVEEHAYLTALERLAASAKTASARAEAADVLAGYRALVPIPNAGGRYSTKILPSPERLDALRVRAGELLSRLYHFGCRSCK